MENKTVKKGNFLSRLVHRFSFNAPVVLIFCIVCVVARILADVTGEGSNRVLFSVYRASFFDPLSYLRVFLHACGHSDWNHLLGNLMFILLLGPMLQEKYGHANTLFVILATALVTGVVNLIFFPNVALLGASGIVFAMILLASFTETKENTIPVTFLLVAVVYLGQQIRDDLFTSDNISQMAHIVGGLMGCGFGFLLNGIRLKKNKTV